ncbi:MAG: NAD-dependent epimerase/dehydratase family protein [Hahellaceae bacterium]|nr:NAD-dependent epimerase/dehydratase family protein [Hahellaceae bacterium]
MKILILGSSGFIGQALAQHLCKLGHHVVGVSRFNIESGVDHEVIECTINNTSEYYSDILSSDIIFHLASDTTPSISIDKPSLEGINNILPTLSFLEALQDSKATLVYISSGGMLYAPTQNKYANENSPIRITSNYAAGKITIESFIEAYSVRTNNKAIILRPSNIYGPGQLPKRKFGLIPTVFSTILTNKTFEVWGSGEIKKNFLYIDDFISLCTCIVQTPDIAENFSIFNAGSDQVVSINNIIGLAESISGVTLKKIIKPSRNIDTNSTTLSSKKALDIYNWKANTTIEAGMKSTWEWMRQKK